MAKTAFMFPGQGAQYVGMGKDIYEAFAPARDIFDRAEAATGLPIKKLCFEGPEEDLNRTDNAQPCIFTVSAAMLAVMDSLMGDSMPTPDVCCGLSLGEYTALYAAGAMDFETGVKLVAKRGELMQAAALARPSGMVAVIALDEKQAVELCNAAAEGQILTPANFNCPGQIVLSGENEACQRAADIAEQYGARGATVLKVAGAFHSEIMTPAAEEFAGVLADVNFADPKHSVVANVDAAEYASAAEIPAKLLAQLTGAVRWQQSVEKILADGVDTYYEIGPGKVLMGLMRRIDRKTKVNLVNSRETAEKLAGIDAGQ
ncbi:MAG: ACP S-malonyltransferase [Phycisphaerae bacterium]|nr:ACP S-malonyltransferase [Phycisphaerae bacterium]